MSRASKGNGAGRSKSSATIEKPSADTGNTVDTVELARATLSAICRDGDAPAAARAQAARTLLELSGALKNTRSNDTRPDEMSLAEIDAALTRLTQQRDNGSAGSA
jgi:hypothetical protein